MIVLSAASAHAIPLPDGAVHCVVTSPPYYSLRKYAGEQAIEWPRVFYRPMPGQPVVLIRAMTSALGLEPTPEAYIAHLVLCFREMRRVLREDGCAWCVIGDSFASQGGPEPAQTKWQVEGASDTQAGGNSRTTGRLKPGDLMLIPHRLALALQADGWTCRNDVVWAKVAPMPESVAGWRWERHRVKVANSRRTTYDRHADSQNGVNNPQSERDGPAFADQSNRFISCPGCPKCEKTGGYVLRRGSWRHTRSHEYVLMLTKGMGYFCDQEKVREALSPDSSYGGTYQKDTKAFNRQGNIGNQGMTITKSESGRNPRSVLTPRPESYPGAHYAVYPASLITPLIRASCPTRCCPVCGAAWAPVVERESSWQDRKAKGADRGSLVIGHNAEHGNGMSHDPDAKYHQVLGYRPTCTHNADAIPGTILDPFVGSGTTLAVARELGLNAIGLDLSPSYLVDHALVRANQAQPALFVE